MDKTLYPVEVLLGEQSRVYGLEFQTQVHYAPAWKRVLLMAHGKADIRCCCLGLGNKRLSIHSRQHSDRFHLARFPNTGPEHSEDCVYYGTDPGLSGMGGYQRGVIQELDDGSTKIKLKVGLQQRATTAPNEANTPLSTDKKKVATRARSGQASMTVLGLLHYLWTETGFNTWTPTMEGKRNLGVLHHHLLRIASAIHVGRVKLSGSLLVATSASMGRQAALNKAKATEAMNGRRRLVVIAPLAHYQPDMEEAQRLPIMGFHGIPHLSLSKDHWDVLQRRFSNELNGWMSGDLVVAIAHTDVPTPASSTMQAQVVNLALMLVTPQWIPVDSGYEAAVVAALAATKRRFEKPLRFDSGAEHVFPDFWLRDRSEVLPMEVWGLTDPDYQARKEQKTAYYDEKYGPGKWWQWDAASGSPMPDFP
ncbi:MAG: DUF1173 family protein [Burkholderiaceae bacterium]|nr:DUF1173 family protein [Burkholderiaceae bacterium]